MKRSLIQGQLLSYDTEINTIQLWDKEENLTVTLSIRPETFPPSCDWNKYIGKEIIARVGNGKLERIFLAPEKKTKMPDQGNKERNEKENRIDQPKFKRQMKDLAFHIGGTMDSYNFGTTGPMDYLTDDLYVIWYYGVKDIHSTGLWLDDDCFHDLPEEERKQIMSFLEHCVEVGAVIYWRNYCRFTWCVLNKAAYKNCCKEFGFKYGDFVGGDIASEAILLLR